MNRTKFFLASGVAIVAITLISLFAAQPVALATEGEPPSPLIVSPAITETGSTTTTVETAATLEQIYRQREETYRKQIEQLASARVERQNEYQAQVEALNAQIATLNGQLETLKTQGATLQAQLDQLTSARAERAVLYQQRLEEAQQQFNAQQEALQARLSDARTRLAEARTILGQ